MRSARLASDEERLWARGGSVEALRTPEAVQRAIRYVVDGQGTELGIVPEEPEEPD